MTGAFPCRGKHTSSCHTKGAEFAGGSAAGAARGVPHGVVVMVASARSWAGAGASAAAACGAGAAGGGAAGPAATVVTCRGPQATIIRPRTTSQGPPRACSLPIKPHELPRIPNRKSLPNQAALRDAGPKPGRFALEVGRARPGNGRASRRLHQLTAAGELSSRAVGNLPPFEVHLDLAVAQVTANELFRQRILDVALDRAAQRPGAVRPVLARDVDDPVDDLRRHFDLHAAVRQVGVELIDQEPR